LWNWSFCKTFSYYSDCTKAGCLIWMASGWTAAYIQMICLSQLLMNRNWALGYVLVVGVPWTKSWQLSDKHLPNDSSEIVCMEKSKRHAMSQVDENKTDNEIKNIYLIQEPAMIWFVGFKSLQVSFCHCVTDIISWWASLKWMNGS
jgi:hypothetical protein